MRFKIVEHYYPVTLTKRSQLCKAKPFFKRFGKIKITGNIKKPAITCLRLTIKTLEQSSNYVRS